MDRDLQAYLEARGAAPPTVAQDARLTSFREALDSANRKFNLTRITADREFQVKHVVDSLLLLAVCPELAPGGRLVADLGCGAGIPGIPLVIVRPDLRVVEIDSTGKKVAFVAAQIEALGLTGCTALQARGRELARRPEHAGAYDAILARAVAPAADLVREARGLLAPGGRLIAYKTPRAIAEERDDARREARKAGLTVTVSRTFVLPDDAGERCFWIARRGEHA